MTTTPDRLAVPPRPRRVRTTVLLTAVIVLIVVSHLAAIRETGFSIPELLDGWDGIADFLSRAIPPDLRWDEVVRPGIEACAVILAIGLLGTTFSIPFSLLLAVLGSRTTSRNPFVYHGARAVMSVFRAVPDVVFALIFITAVGLGPFPGVLAIICHNTGVMGKLWSEAMEESDQGPVEALRVAGASNAQIAIHAVLPSVTPQFVGLLLYRFDVNVRSSLVLGLIGAGGIGRLIDDSTKLFQFDEMLTYILLLLVLIITVDVVSGLIRRRLAQI